MAETISETSVSSEELVSWPESKDDSGVMAARTIRPEKTQEAHGDVMLRPPHCLGETARQTGEESLGDHSTHPRRENFSSETSVPYSHQHLQEKCCWGLRKVLTGSPAPSNASAGEWESCPGKSNRLIASFTLAC